VIIGLTAASILWVHPYQYGLEDQSIIIPFIKEAMNPDLYPDDYLVAQKPYFITVLWELIAFIARSSGLSLPTLFLAGHVAAVFFTFLTLYRLGITLLGRSEMAAGALFLLLLANGMSLGDGTTMEGIFNTRVAALPLLLLSWDLLLREKPVRSYLVLGLAFLIHPLTAAHMLGLVFLASLVSLRRLGPGRIAVGFLLFLALASPLLVWKGQHDPASLSLFQVPSGWMEILKLRSAHHVSPIGWHWETLIRTLVLSMVLIWLLVQRSPSYKRRSVLVALAAVAAMCLTGIVFTEILPLAVVIQFQLFRSSVFLNYHYYLFFSAFYFSRLSPGERISSIAAVALGLGALLYKGPGWPLQFAFLGGLGLLGMALRIKGWGRIKGPQLLMGMLILVYAIGLGGGFGPDRWSMENAQDPDWLDVQIWAREKTELGDAFIVPPGWMGFRVESERTIYGDWKDGTQTFFNPDFGREWLRRMKLLGYTPDLRTKGLEDLEDLDQAYSRLGRPEILAVARDLGWDRRGVFVVRLKGSAELDFPLRHENGSFLVYEVGP
jgi:hypothetical protein